MTSTLQNLEMSACQRRLLVSGMRPLSGYSRLLEFLLRGVALSAVQSHLHLRRVQGARLQDSASECGRLGVHAVVQEVTCPTEGVVVVVRDRQVRGVASSLPQRLVLELQE